MTAFGDRLGQRRLVADGALGTMIQAAGPSPSDFEGYDGCNEILSLTRPDLVSAIHGAYLAAGADFVSTNTFNCNLTALGDYGLADRAAELAAAGTRLARAAADRFSTPDWPRFAAGSLGPGTKLPTLGQVGYAGLRDFYELVAAAMLAAGADFILLETCQDVLQAKAAVNGARRARAAVGRDVPILADFTVETTGTLLVGADVAAVVTSLAPLGVAALGLNCATGPDEMREPLRQLDRLSPVPLVVMPNAGLPELTAAGARYPLGPAEFAAKVAALAQDLPLAVLGGCCGTTPDHIAALVERLGESRHGPLPPRPRPPVNAVASTYTSVDLTQDVSYLAVGERANANGSKAFREALLEGRWEDCVAIGRDQAGDGAHVVDLNVDSVGRDGRADMAELAGRFATAVATPCMLDSTEPATLQAGLERLPGRAIVNSVNFEDGAGPGSRYRQTMDLVAEHGAAVVVLCIDEQGQARTAGRKVAVAERALADLQATYGLGLQDIVVDCLTYPIGTGQDETRRDGIETLDAIRRLTAAHPGLHTTLGISNVSFGLNPAARRVLNSVFLHAARAAGLDTAIVHPGRIMPLASLGDDVRQAAEDLLYDRRTPDYDPLERLLGLTAGQSVAADKAGRAAELAQLPLAERLRRRITDAEAQGLEADLDEALRTAAPLDIINGDLLEGMRIVGERFGSGETQLPFVLQSAEVMKKAVDHLRPHLAGGRGAGKGTLVLATVKGDVHDIGKNLVDIIVSNNGYRVVNLGIKQPIADVIAAAEANRADAIGLSGLLVKSTQVMRDDLAELNARGLAARYPVLLGGAALTRQFVEQDLRPLYQGEVYYAKDAFAGLALMEQITSGAAGQAAPAPRPAARPAGPRPAGGPARSAVSRGGPVPTPPFWGSRIVRGVALDEIARWLDRRALFAGRWGLKAGKTGPSAAELAQTEGEPRLRRWLAYCQTHRLAQPGVAYGYFPAYSEGEELVVLAPGGGLDGELVRFQFPRQQREPWLAIPDYFRDRGEAEILGPDVLALQLVTLGAAFSEETNLLFEQGSYRDYLELHGLGVQLAEALAELWHDRIRSELGLPRPTEDIQAMIRHQDYTGERFSFGYPACPDLAQRAGIVKLLGPERLEVWLTEESQLVPEQSTDALIVSHPQAHYFNAEER